MQKSKDVDRNHLFADNLCKQFGSRSEPTDYANDNTVSAADRVLSKLIANLAEDSLMLIKWFADNHMKANPDKFQAIAVGKRTKDENITFNLNNIIHFEDHVKLLSVTIDFKLSFDLHIPNRPFSAIVF